MDKILRDFSSFYSEEEIVGLTRDLVRIPSHVDTENREVEIGNYIYDWAVKNGFKAEKVPVDGPRSNVYIHLKGEGNGPTLLLNGHMDTVPPYDMTIDPYEGFVKEGYIWGRGTNDMKGAVACMMLSLLVIKRAGLKLKGDVIITAVIDEEEASIGTEDFILKGGKADGAVVGEPSGYEYSAGCRGLEWIQVRFIGKTVHGGQAHLGINAISMASRFIEKVNKELEPKINARTNEYMGPAIHNWGKIYGGDQVSTVAGECVLQFDRRYVPGETIESVLAEYQEIIDELHDEDPKFNAEMTLMPNGQMRQLYHAPLIPEMDSRINIIIEKLLCEYLGVDKAPLNRCRGWTDAGALSTYAHIPSVIFGPGEIERSHTKDERTPVKMLYDFVGFYASIISAFCGVIEE